MREGSGTTRGGVIGIFVAGTLAGWGLATLGGVGTPASARTMVPTAWVSDVLGTLDETCGSYVVAAALDGAEPAGAGGFSGLY